jgi:hypothetical protein
MIVLTSAAAPADEEAPPADPPPRPESPPPPGEGPRPPEDRRERVERIIERYVPGYHLGISVGRVPEVLDAQLDLKGHGVVVNRVTSGSPADKAGIKANDIVLAAGDKPLKDPSDLARAASDSEGKEMTLKLVRAGKPMTVNVTPEKSDAPRGTVFWAGEPEIRALEEKIREKLKDAGVDMRLQLIHPGAFLPKGVDFLIDRRADFPEDLTVKINKQGKNPAEIEVKKGDKTWTVKEDDLKELPEDVRGHVEGLLGRGPHRFKIVGPEFNVTLPHPPRPGQDGPGAPGEEGAGPPRPGGPDGPPPPRRRGDRDAFDGPPDRERMAGRLEQRLEEMNRRMQEMREQLEGLRRYLREDRDDRPRRPERPDGPERRDRPEPPEGAPPSDT